MLAIPDHSLISPDFSSQTPHWGSNGRIKIIIPDDYDNDGDDDYKWRVENILSV